MINLRGGDVFTSLTSDAIVSEAFGIKLHGILLIQYLAYVYAALTLDNPTAKASDGELFLTLISKDDDDYNYEQNIERKRYLFKSIPEVLSVGRREDLKRLLRLCLRWYKKAPIRLNYHYYQDKPQSYWLDRLIECTRYEDDTPLWMLWSEVFEMFWW